MNNLIYTGVGSRETPASVLRQMTAYAKRLAQLGWTLRSGAADGADAAFEAGCDQVQGPKEIYLPWPRFKGRNHRDRGVYLMRPEAMLMASDVHPAWARCSEAAKALHARNCHQVLGLDLETPARFVVCWTSDEAEIEAECSISTGGTATAIRVADRYGVPVINLARKDASERLTATVNAYKELKT